MNTIGQTHAAQKEDNDVQYEIHWIITGGRAGASAARSARMFFNLSDVLPSHGMHPPQRAPQLKLVEQMREN